MQFLNGFAILFIREKNSDLEGRCNKRLTLRSHEAKTFGKQGVSKEVGEQNALFEIAAKQYFGHLMILWGGAIFRELRGAKFRTLGF